MVAAFSRISSGTLQCTAEKNMNASIEQTAVDVSPIGFKMHIDERTEDLIVQDVWLQDVSANKIELETMCLIINSVGSRFVRQCDLMSASLLPPGRVIGRIIIHVSKSPSATPLISFKSLLDLRRILKKQGLS
jgi:hypothetical protein